VQDTISHQCTHFRTHDCNLRILRLVLVLVLNQVKQILKNHIHEYPTLIDSYLRKLTTSVPTFCIFSSTSACKIRDILASTIILHPVQKAGAKINTIFGRCCDAARCSLLALPRKSEIIIRPAKLLLAIIKTSGCWVKFKRFFQKIKN
jgi:hypothetical protein